MGVLVLLVTIGLTMVNPMVINGFEFLFEPRVIKKF